MSQTTTQLIEIVKKYEAILHRMREDGARDPSQPLLIVLALGQVSQGGTPWRVADLIAGFLDLAADAMQREQAIRHNYDDSRNQAMSGELP